MLFVDQPPTPYDLRFKVLGIPTRVNPIFWLVAVLLGRSYPPKYLLIWVAVVFVSILVHELGHALMARRYGWPPNILLYAFGGLAIFQPTRHDPRKQMLILLAGPGAGFALAAAVLLACRLNGHPVSFALGMPYGINWAFVPFDSFEVTLAVEFLLFVNIFWGLVNLLPVYPLDGGQFLRELLYYLRAHDPVSNSLWMSAYTGAAVAIVAALKLQDYYLALMFGYLAYNSFITAQAYSGRGGGYGGW